MDKKSKPEASETPSPNIADFLDGKDLTVDGVTTSIEEVLQAINCPTMAVRAFLGQQTKEPSTIVKRHRRGNRMKVYDHGYIFTYDKDSQCGQRSFWRCERKSECQARVHTNPVTNQIIKRINEHTHDPPEDLPPWLVLNQTSPEPEDGEVNGQVATGILINKKSVKVSPNVHISHMVEQELRQSENGVKVEQPDEIKEDETSISAPPPLKRKKRSGKEKEHSRERELAEQPEQFWELFDITKKVFHSLKNAAKIASIMELPSTSTSSDPEVALWLDNHKLGEYKELLAKYNMETLRSLTSSNCISLLGNEQDALLLYYSLKNTSDSAASEPITIFLGSKEDSNEEIVYQMLQLKEKTSIELRASMVKRGLISSKCIPRLCAEGPNGIFVEITDMLINTWKTDSVFQFSTNNGVCKLIKKP